MANYNIQMEYFNGSSYDVLQPQTILNNITDWASNLYSQSQINDLLNQKANSSQIDSLQSQITSLNSKVGGLGIRAGTTTYERVEAHTYGSWKTVNFGFKPDALLIRVALSANGSSYQLVFSSLESNFMGNFVEITSNGFRYRSWSYNDSAFEFFSVNPYIGFSW